MHNTSTFASEQAITALEHSSKPTTELLVDAADIIGFDLSHHAQKHDSWHQSPVLTTDSARFREQWILRWIIKRLSQSVDSKQEPVTQHTDLRKDLNTWTLIDHLLSTIPKRLSRDILVERGFCRIFSECLAINNDYQEGSLLNTQVNINTDQPRDGRGRPTKRRKLSPETDLPIRSTTQPEPSLPAILLSVAGQIAEILIVGQSSDQHPHTRIPSDWIDNVDTAALLLGRLIATTNLLRSENHKLSQGVKEKLTGPCHTLEKWVELWQAHTVVTNSLRNQDPHSAFKNNVLIPALDFLAHPAPNSLASTSKVLQRQIAIHCILPARSIFQKRFVTVWRSWKTEPEVKTIQRIVNDLSASMGCSATYLNATQDEARAVIFLNIASQLIPRSDVVRRKAESSWIEAFYLCLSCMLLVSPKKPNACQNPLQMLSSRVSDNEGHPVIMVTSTKLLDALQETGIEVAFHFWQFCVRQAMAEPHQQLSITTLAKIVRLNSSVFVASEESLESSHLSSLCTILSTGLDVKEATLRIVFNDVLAPILEEFGRTRKIDAFIAFWQPRLVESFHYRIGMSAGRSSLAIWDHPDLLEHFSSVCQRYVQPSLRTELWEKVAGDMVSLVGIVGPTHEIFARITILIYLIKPLEKSQPLEKGLEDQVSSMSDAIFEALKRSTDYQGHRWRLWRFFEQLVLLSPMSLNQETSRVLSTSWPNLTSTKLNELDTTLQHSSSRYMEQYHYFCAIVSFYEAEGNDSETIFLRALSWIDTLLQLHNEQTVAVEAMISPWNGLPYTMDSDSRMLSACLARLAASSIPLTMAQVGRDDFLANLTSLTFQKGELKTNHLATVAEALLAKVVTSTPTDLNHTYTELMKQKDQMNGLPQLLRSLTQDVVSKTQVFALVQIVCKNMQELSMPREETFIDYLSLLTKITSHHATLAADTLELKLYIKVLERTTSEATLEQLLVAQRCIQRMAHSQIRSSNSGTGHGSASDSRLIPALKWTKKQLEELSSLKGLKVLDQYTGYFVLAILRAVRDIQDDDFSEDIHKSIKKVRKHQNTVILDQCMLYLSDSPDTTRLYSVFLLLDCLNLPLSEKSLDSNLQSCFQGIVQAILALDAGSPKRPMSRQEVKVIAELWQMLSKHVIQEKTKPISDFPLTKFAQDYNQADCIDSLELQSRLATRYASRALLHSPSDLTTEIIATNDHSNTKARFEMFLALAAKIKHASHGNESISVQTINDFDSIASLRDILNEGSPSTLLIRLELSRMVFEKHPSVINQYVIDTTLTSIALLASKASHIYVDKDDTQIRPEHIFDRLCTILSTLLVRHRRRLTGRHHLLLPILQNLLKCLFYPPTRKHLKTSSVSNAEYLASLPKWLNPPTYTSTLTLPQTSAKRFSRVLQQLCDPSSSSARHVSRNRQDSKNNLVDVTKALRRQVSQHTQYLLQTYCQVMLDGYIAPDVKEKLLPGMYAIMNATDVEVMRGLNAAMDANQRAIWKDLYADWKTYGKWNQR